VAVAYQPHRFTREQFYAVAKTLDPKLRYELLNGTIFEMSPANPPHAGIVTFFNHRFRTLDPAKFLVRVQDTLEIEPDGAPQPDIAVVTFRGDFYGTSHPTGADAGLVIEVGDTQRKPREKMADYMRDGRIPIAWRIDIPNRCVELWDPTNITEPVATLHGAEVFEFANLIFTVDDVFFAILK
jgi:Uma2 family endonuclease